MREKGELVDPARHLQQPWRLRTLAPDFEVLDVWAFPILADPAKGETFHEFFQVVLENGLDSDSAVTRFLSWLRAVVGDTFSWEFAPGEGTVAGTTEKSLVERLTDEDRRTNRITGTGESTIENAITKLALVYERENDALFEIHNKTVSALFHLAFVDVEDGKKEPELAVYTKMRGLKSKIYMKMIEPFRHMGVYPQWIARITHKWQEHLEALRTGKTDSASTTPAPSAS